MNIQETGSTNNKRLNLLVHARPGAGKTRFSGTAFKTGRFKPLILSAESGLLCLEKLRKEPGYEHVREKGFPFVKIEKFEDIDEVRKFIRFGKHAYDTVILDSLTEIQQVCMDKILREERIEKARIQDWGTLNQRMVSMIRDFRDMEINLIVTALTDTITDEETGGLMFSPLVQGKLRDTLAGYFDEVFMMQNKEVKGEDGKPTVKHFMQTQGTHKVLAKDRSGKLPIYIAPDFITVYDQIYGEEQ